MHHFAHRAEALHGVVADKAVDLNELLVGEPEISLANGYQHVAVLALGPDSESIVGIIGRALAVTALGVHQHRIDDEWIAFPFPPRALGTAGQIGRIAGLSMMPSTASASAPAPAAAGSLRATARSSQVANVIRGERSTRGSSRRAMNCSSRLRRSVKGRSRRSSSPSTRRS